MRRSGSARPVSAEALKCAPVARTFVQVGLVLAAACHTPTPETSGFGTTPGMSTAPASSGGGSSSSGADDSTTSSTGSSSAASSASTEPLRDVGAMHDVGSSQPAGCKGKIDFLFVMSRQGFVSEIQTQLVDAFPKFIDTIQSKFADFDYHIMVIDGDPEWGLPPCDDDCKTQGWCEVPGYPCGLVDTITSCDETIGAGTIFNAGGLAPNKPCDVPEGRRYLAKGDPNLSETFACMAQVGMSGRDWLGEALTAAMSPALREGCNAGFLRDDALLVITIATATSDLDSDGTPEEWAQAIVDAKHGDLDSIVMFGIVDEYSPTWCDTVEGHRMCELVRQFPYHTSIDCDVLDYGPAFDAATDLVTEACDAFIPG